MFIPLLWALVGEQCARIGYVGVCGNRFCGVSWSVIVFYGMLLCIRGCWFLGDFLLLLWRCYSVGIGSVCGMGDFHRLRNDLPISWVVVAVWVCITWALFLCSVSAARRIDGVGRGSTPTNPVFGG